LTVSDQSLPRVIQPQTPQGQRGRREQDPEIIALRARTAAVQMRTERLAAKVAALKLDSPA
jgi:hypothetical protein